jgi:iron(III) transport system permease protein
MTVGITTATLGVVITAGVGYMITRLRWAGRTPMDLLAWLPICVPGIVLAIGLLWGVVYLPIYGTVWVIALAFLIRGMPTASRFFTSTMVQISNDIHEAALVHGVPWLTAFGRIWLALLRPAFAGAWMFLFVLAVRQLDVPLLLGGPRSELLSVTIFQWASRDPATAACLAIVQVAIVALVYAALQVAQARRAPTLDAS